MGKKVKFSDDQLLDAVVRYQKEYRGIIKATKLAEWSRANIPDLFEVRDYHFTRPVNIKDEKTGKMCEQKKACTLRIDEINQSRSIVARTNSNMLLKSSNPYSFLDLPQSAQKKLIVETRSAFGELEHRNIKLERENVVLRKINDECLDGLKRTESMLKEINRKINLLEKRINYIMRVTDEEKRSEMLAEIGLSDGEINLETYMNSLKCKTSEVFNINKELSSYYQSESDIMDVSTSLDCTYSNSETDMDKEVRNLILDGLFGKDQNEDV